MREEVALPSRMEIDTQLILKGFVTHASIVIKVVWLWFVSSGGFAPDVGGVLDVLVVFHS